MSMEDAAHILSEFLYSIENIPAETSFILEEIGHIDSTIQETRHAIAKRDVGNIQKHIKTHGLLSENVKEGQLVSKIRSDYSRLTKLSDEKVSLAERGVRMLDKHVRKLQSEFERLKELGYDIGDVEPTPTSAASANNGNNSLGMGGFPQLDMSSSSTSSNTHKKRKLAVNTTGINMQGGGQGSALGSGMPTSAQLQAFQNNLYAQQQMHHGGTPTQGNMQGMYQMQAAAAQSPMGNNPYAANMGQYNQAALSAQQQQQQQPQLAQSYQNAYTSVGQMQNSGGAAGAGGGAGNNNGSRPHRPSRLSSSFSALGGGPQTQQLLPSSTSAHLPPGMPSPSLGASTNSQPGGPLSASMNGLNASIGAGGNNKRGRPSTGGASQGSAVPKKKYKKRIQISDEESVADEAMSVEDVDAEGEEEDGADVQGGEEDKSIMTVVSSVPAQRRAGGTGTAAQQKAASRAGTPLASVPHPGGNAQSGNNNASPGGPRIKNVGGNRGRGNQQQQQLQAQSNKKEDDDAEGEGEEEDADAEGEEDWGQEVDETNADDPTLYCVCQRVSYGNMIACDNPACQFEWFHWACVKVTKQPEDNQTWYCPECRPQMLGAGASNSNNNKGTLGQSSSSTGGNPKALLSSSTGGGGAYAQLAAQQREMMFAAASQQSNGGGAAGGGGGRASRRN